MRIVIVVSDFPKVTETFVLSNAMHYMQAGHDVTVFHLKAFRQNEVVHDHARPVVARGQTFGWCDAPALGGLLWALRTAPRSLLSALGAMVRAHWHEPKRLAASLALVPKACALGRQCAQDGTGHIHAEFAGYPATAGWIAARLSGVPFSFSAHAHDIFLSQGLLVEKAGAARFVRVISQFNRRFLSALPGFPDARLEVLRCGVALPQDSPVPQAPAQGQPWRLVFVGALLPRKGLDRLLEAMALLPDLPLRLDVVGGGRMLAEWQALAQARGLEVTFHGAQPSDRVREVMTQAHLLAAPSRLGEGGRSEGIPVVLMEAMALGRPVVASRLSGIPELVEEGETGHLALPDDAASLARALRSALEDWPRTLRMAEAGRARVAAHYDIRKTAAALLKRITETSRT